MFSNQPAELLLPTPLRTCCSVSASSASASSSSQQRFLAGSSTSSGENALHLLRYHEDANELGHDAVLSHPTGEVWCLASNPRDGSLVVTCGGGSGGHVAGGAATTKLWRIPADLLEKDDDLPYGDDDVDGGGGSGPIMDSEAPVDLISEATLFVDSDDVLGGRITSALFRPVDPDDVDGMFADGMGGGGGGGIDAAKDLITVNAATGILTRWDLEAGATEVGQILPPSGAAAGVKSTVMSERRAAWDPHNANLVSVTGPRGIVIHDLRTGGGGGVSSIDDPLVADVTAILEASSRGAGNHRYGTNDISYNPNLPNVLTTSGKDGLIKFWDLRTTTSSSSVASGSSASNPAPSTMATTASAGAKHQRRIQPMKVLRGGHTHWSNRVAYNPHHDQLLLSSGTDGIVNLWRVGSVSSAPLLDLDAGGDGDGGENEIIGLGGGGGTDDDDDEERQDDIGQGDGGSGGGGDARVSKFEFPDSVYDLCWSSTDAWTFLCVGYDGTVALNHVPSREKYKILL